jgi:CreA protein
MVGLQSPRTRYDRLGQHELKDGERVFDEHRSLAFKKLQVVRFFDRKRNVLVYVAYSDRIIEGSPKNSISTVPIMRWPEP